MTRLAAIAASAAARYCALSSGRIWNSLCQKPKSTQRKASTHHVTSAAAGKMILWLAANTAVRNTASRPVMPSRMPLKSWRSRDFCSYSSAFHKIDAREAVGGELDDVSDGLARLEVRRKMSARSLLTRSGRKPDRRRDALDAARIEIGPDDARAHGVVALGREPALHGLVGGVAQREDDPVGIGARRRRAHGHAAGGAVDAGRGLDLQVVAAALVGLADGGDVDAILVGRDLDRRQRRSASRAMPAARTPQARISAAARVRSSVTRLPAICRALTCARSSSDRAYSRWSCHVPLILR